MVGFDIVSSFRRKVNEKNVRGEKLICALASYLWSDIYKVRLYSLFRKNGKLLGDFLLNP